MMESVRETEKKYCSGAMIAAIVIGVFFIFSGYRPLGKGLLLGTIFSVINFVLMGETLSSRLGKSRHKTFFVSLGSIFFRYMLLAIPLIIAIRMAEFSLLTVIVGLFMVQLLILAEQVLGILSPTRRKQF